MGHFLSKGKRRAPKGWNKQGFTHTNIPLYLSLPANMENPILWLHDKAFGHTAASTTFKFTTNSQTFNHCHMPVLSTFSRDGSTARLCPKSCLMFSYKINPDSVPWLGGGQPFKGLANPITQPASTRPTASSRASAAQQHQHYKWSQQDFIFSLCKQERKSWSNHCLKGGCTRKAKWNYRHSRLGESSHR